MRALHGYEIILGPEHTSTLQTVNNLAHLYADQGRLKDSEDLHIQALLGYQKAVGRECFPTYIPALQTLQDLASLFDRQHQTHDARALYVKALSGYQQVYENDHPICLALRNKHAISTQKEEDEFSVVDKHQKQPTRIRFGNSNSRYHAGFINGVVRDILIRKQSN